MSSHVVFVYSYMWASGIIILWQECIDLLILEYLLLLLAFHRPAVSSLWWIHFPCTISCVPTKNEDFSWQRRDVYLVNFLLKLKEPLLDSKSFWNNLFLTCWKERTWYCMMWFHNVAQAAAPDPSYSMGWSPSLRAPRRGDRWGSIHSPSSSLPQRPLWNAPNSNPDSCPILPKTSMAGYLFVLVLDFFLMVLFFPDKKQEPNLIFISPDLGIASGLLK